MIANILVFEDNKYSNFLPLAYLRPVYDLISGMSTLLAKIVRSFPDANISLHCREYLKNIVKENHAGIGVNNVNTGIGCLFVNGRLLAKDNFSDQLVLDGRDRVFINDEEEVIAAYLNTDNLYIIQEMLKEIFVSKQLISTFRNKAEVTRVDIQLIEYPWELVNESAKQIVQDYSAVVPGGIIKGEVSSSASIIDEHRIYVGENSKIYPNVTLNAENGPIYIGENTKVKPGTYIQGPAYVGNSSELINATILPGAAIGPKSKISGTVSNSILHGYSVIDNAQIKSSYLADSVDVLAGSLVRDDVLPFANTGDIYIDGYELHTSENKLGLFCADFSRIGPNNLVSSGTVMGISSFFELGNDTVPRYLPSFIKQVTLNKFEELNTAKSLDIVHYYLKQKDISLSKVEEDLIEYVFSKFTQDRKLDKMIY